jgi:hypothetical protein
MCVSIMSRDGQGGLCASIVSGDGQEGRTTKWFQANRPLRHFEGGKEDKERKG